MTQIFVLPKGERSLKRLIQFLDALGQDKAWRITVALHCNERSDLQNHSLWGVAYDTLKQETGNDPENLHWYFCGEFFGWVEDDVLGMLKKRPRRSTTKDENGKRHVISSLQFKEFYEFIQRRAAESVGVFVPDPDPDYWMKAD